MIYRNCCYFITFLLF